MFSRGGLWFVAHFKCFPADLSSNVVFICSYLINYRWLKGGSNVAANGAAKLHKRLSDGCAQCINGAQWWVFSNMAPPVRKKRWLHICMMSGVMLSYSQRPVGQAFTALFFQMFICIYK